MANKLNLVFDFNNIAMRALFTCGFGTGEESVSNFDTDRECAVLVRKIAIDMAYVLRLFNPDRVIVAADSKESPWRNELYDPASEEEYKGNRVKDETKNWNKIWEALNDYKIIMKTKGFVVSELPTAEADDLAALWKIHAFNEGDSVVLVSSDRDWLQLVAHNPSINNFCVCFNPIANNKSQKKLYITESFETWLNSVSKPDIFFNNYSPLKNTFKNISAKDPKINYEIIDPNDVVLNKIMCGDDGDNAPAFYQYFKNGRKTRVTPAKAKKIFETLNIHTVKDLCDSAEANALEDTITSVMKLEDGLNIDVNERLIRQRRLVELNPILFPQDIIDAYRYHVNDVKEDGYIPTETIKLDYILQNTKYLDKNYSKARESSIFDNLKNLEQFIKPISPATPLF